MTERVRSKVIELSQSPVLIAAHFCLVNSTMIESDRCQGQSLINLVDSAVPQVTDRIRLVTTESMASYLYSRPTFPTSYVVMP
jgi:hypothetical protein